MTKQNILQCSLLVLDLLGNFKLSHFIFLRPSLLLILAHQKILLLLFLLSSFSNRWQNSNLILFNSVFFAYLARPTLIALDVNYNFICIDIFFRQVPFVRKNVCDLFYVRDRNRFLRNEERGLFNRAVGAAQQIQQAVIFYLLEWIQKLKFSLRTCEFITVKRVHQLGTCFQLFLNPLVRIQQVGVSRILGQILILVDNFVSYGRNIWKHARAVVLITFLHFNHLLLLVSAFLVHLFVVLKLIILIIVL